MISVRETQEAAILSLWLWTLAQAMGVPEENSDRWLILSLVTIFPVKTNGCSDKR